jgi:hypothetical protein
MPGGLSPLAQMIFKAIQTYGMVVTDTSGSVAIGAETSADWTGGGTDPITAAMAGQQPYQTIANLPWSSLQAINPPG